MKNVLNIERLKGTMFKRSILPLGVRFMLINVKFSLCVESGKETKTHFSFLFFLRKMNLSHSLLFI